MGQFVMIKFARQGKTKIFIVKQGTSLSEVQAFIISCILHWQRTRTCAQECSASKIVKKF